MGILDTLFEKRSLENPNTPLSAIYDTISRTPTGLSVTPENALEVTAVWAAVRMISSTIATLPLPVYQHTVAGKDKARQHPLYRLLHDRPNPETSSFVFRETMAAHLLLYGNAYAEIERNGAGEPVALWPIPPWTIRVERRNGHKLYIARTTDGQEIPLSVEQVLHIPGFSLDGCTGLLPVHYSRNAIALSKATESFGSAFFGNGAAPSGIITVDGKLDPEAAAKLKKLWNHNQGGLSNAQRIAILDAGNEWTPLGIPPEHAQFLETRKFSVAEVARIFLIPPHLLADLERATFSNIEHQQIAFVVHCIEPWCRRIEAELNYSLFDNGEYFAEFNLKGLMRGDSKSRAEFYAALLDRGVYSVNEVRAFENENPVDGGDTRYVPLNMTPLAA